MSFTFPFQVSSVSRLPRYNRLDRYPTCAQRCHSQNEKIEETFLIKKIREKHKNKQIEKIEETNFKKVPEKHEIRQKKQFSPKNLEKRENKQVDITYRRNKF